MILVPVKNLAGAKQRLAAVLDQPARTELAKAMLQDVVEELSAWKGRPEIALVTSDPFARSLALRHRFEVIEDPANLGETDAIETATAECLKRGAEWTLVIPADIPLLESWELQRMLDAMPQQGIVIAPAGDGRGTNAILRRPAGLIPLRFGNDSFKPHLAAARATGLPCVVLEFPGISVDVDNPGDLPQVVSAPGNRRTQQLLRKWKIVDKASARS